MNPEDIQVLLISNTAGKDDEGMKKIARMLADSFREMAGINAKVVSIRDAVSNAAETDILHFIGGPTFRSVLIAAWCKWKNKRVGTILTFTNPIWNWFADFMIRVFVPNKIIVSSNYWRNWANQKGISYEYLAISGVDLERFSTVSDSEKIEIRKELGLPLEKIIVLHVGHLKDDRNLLMLLHAQRHQDIQVVIVGSTTTEQSNLLIQRLENAGCIVVREYKPNIEVFYQSADCYVFPTMDSEAAVQIPLSTLEAMAVNLPIITTKFGGLSDFISESNHFIFLDADQFVDLADMIRVIVSEGTSKTRHDVEKFAWENIANQLQKIYSDLCEELN